MSFHGDFDAHNLIYQMRTQQVCDEKVSSLDFIDHLSLSLSPQTRDAPSHRRGAVRGDPGVQLEVYLFFHKSTDCLNSDLSLSDDSAPVRQHWVQTCICYRSTLAPQVSTALMLT